MEIGHARWLPLHGRTKERHLGRATVNFEAKKGFFTSFSRFHRFLSLPFVSPAPPAQAGTRPPDPTLQELKNKNAPFHVFLTDLDSLPFIAPFICPTSTLFFDNWPSVHLNGLAW